MMLVDDFLDRVDWKRMIKGGLVMLALFSFCIVGVKVIFQHKPEVKLKRNEFEFGEDIDIAEQIISVDGEKIYPAMIDGNKIETETREITFNDINSEQLGEQEIIFNIKDKVTQKEMNPISVNVKVIDTVGPEIMIKEMPEFDIDAFGDISVNDIATVNDQCTAVGDIALALLFKDRPEPGKEVIGEVTATDLSGNITKRSFSIRIKAIESPDTVASNPPIPEEKHEETISAEPQQPPVSTPLEQPVTVPEPETPPVENKPVQKPATQYFMFKDGYNMGNVENACYAAGDASGFGWSCIPLTDGNGIFTGMMLTFE